MWWCQVGEQSLPHARPRPILSSSNLLISSQSFDFEIPNSQARLGAAAAAAMAEEESLVAWERAMVRFKSMVGDDEQEGKG